MRTLVLLGGLLATGSAFAQLSPVGLWRNVDDKTGEVKAEIRITEANGVVNGRIVRRLAKGAKPDAVCEECSDDRKGQPLDGLEIIRGARKADGKDAIDATGLIVAPGFIDVHTHADDLPEQPRAENFARMGVTTESSPLRQK